MGGPRAELARLRAAAWRRFRRGDGRPPAGRAWDSGLRGTPCKDRGRPGSGRPGRPRWQLPGVWAAAPCSPWRRGRGHRFPGRAARSLARGAQRGDGATGALPGLPRPRHDEWASVPGPGGSGHLRPGQPSALGTRPGARPGPPGSPDRTLVEGGRTGVRASRRVSAKRQGSFPRLQIINGSSLWCNG